MASLLKLMSFNGLSSLLLGTNVYEVDNATHTYTALGTYTITCVAMNAIGNTTIQYVVVVQVPVSADFVVNSSSPVAFTTGNNTQVNTAIIRHAVIDTFYLSRRACVTPCRDACFTVLSVLSVI